MPTVVGGGGGELIDSVLGPVPPTGRCGFKVRGPTRAPGVTATLYTVTQENYSVTVDAFAVAGILRGERQFLDSERGYLYGGR